MGETIPTAPPHLSEFETHRRVLTGAAYRFLGSYADAEDVVQEAWLRWAAVPLDDIDDPRAYLLTVTSRLALNRLRSRRRQREDYLGEWLPEPVSDIDVISPEAVAETSESIAMAMMVVLETLSPLERSAFILHDVFGMAFGEIASTLDRSESAVRQLASRARRHVRDRAPRHKVDPEEHREITNRFLQAVRTGDMAALLPLIAPDAVLVTDGGGKRAAAIRPIHTRDNIVKVIDTFRIRPGDGLDLVAGRANGQPALFVTDTANGTIDTVLTFSIQHGAITAIYLVRNPDKLTAVTLSAVDEKE